MGRTRDFLKVALAVAFIIALLSASYIGINHLALTAAIGREEVLPKHTAAINLPEPVIEFNEQEVIEVFVGGGIPFDTRDIREEITDSIEQNVTPEHASESFVMPRLTIFVFEDRLDDFRSYQAIPPYALSVEEAAFIGAYYVWDVLGKSIDGMYVRMLFNDSSLSTRTHWVGFVSSNINAVMPQPGPAASEYARRYGVLQFTIDGVTGERIKLWYYDDFLVNPTFEEIEQHSNDMRYLAVSSGWSDMSLDERKAKVGLTPERLEAYLQAAMKLAVRHFMGRYFDESVISDINLVDYSRHPLIIDGVLNEKGDFVFVPVRLQFEATDNTGRAAIIRFPIETARWMSPGVYISSLHSDFLPGSF